MHYHSHQYLVAIVWGILEACMLTAQDAYITMLGTDDDQSDDSDAKVEKYFWDFLGLISNGYIFSYLVSLNIFHIEMCHLSSNLGQSGVIFGLTKHATKLNKRFDEMRCRFPVK